MSRPQVLLLTGYGINCEEETAFAFSRCGAGCRIVHVNDLIDRPEQLQECQVFVVPGGFSYGDDTGSGNALANKMRHTLWPELMDFISKDRLVLGICNGFQVLVNLGLLPGLDGDYGNRQAALIANSSTRYECRWVELQVQTDRSVFLQNLDRLQLPVAHGEGRFYVPPAVAPRLQANDAIALTYVDGEGNPADGRFPHNPNGSLLDIAGICDDSGKVFGLMPHPERALVASQLPSWPEIAAGDHPCRWDDPAPGLALFQNAVNYFL
ncbi:MAG: phosphoribosylformylglycinamidine synthase I [Deltaproteobacteria bacterium]|nr:phosphoribosylformylglycinamidine synthase I [Candidatus Anaeroferrophillus wilburensis]MBN2889153.1 phosphoribosylformylglycinamidine synthase I [Deltaproteobacteria bacterium]